jgi:hypothetical protein
MAAPMKKSAAGGRPEKYTQEWLIEEAKALREWIVQPRSLWLKGFAYERGYRPGCLSEFAEKSKEFSEALEFAKDEQERKFVHGAWSKEMDMAFVKHFMPRMLKDRPEWKTSWDKDEKEAKSSDLLDFLASLMSQAKSKDKPDANEGT